MRPNRTVDSLADELVSFWISLFEPKSWPERLELLNEVHEQLQEDIGDLDLYAAASPVFIQKLIERLNGGRIMSVAQAYIYANSGDEQHRRAAGEWLNLHRDAKA